MDFKTNSIQKLSYILRFYRRLKNYTQQDMAELINISLRNYQRLEAGDVEPKLETLGQISSVLNLSVSTLLSASEVRVLNLSDLATYNEYKNFHLVNEEADLLDHSLLFAKLLIEEDRKIKPESIAPIVRVEGDKAYLCDELVQKVGLTKNKVNIDDHLTFGNCVERWEIVFRNKLSNPVIENSLIFPNGFFVFEEYHYNMIANPDNPTTECLIRDVSNRRTLENWITDYKQNQHLDAINKRHIEQSKIVIK